MYVVRYKDRVVLGLIPWNSQYITDVMRSRYRVTISLPFDEPEASMFPLDVNADIRIFAAEEDRPQTINPMIQYYHGPSWDFVNNKMIARYTVESLPLEDAKNNYRGKAANLRYNKEVSGTEVTINGVVYKIETARGERTKYVEKLVLMGENDTVNWKFPSGWVTLTKAQLLSIVNAIDAHVQSAFNEELQLNEAITDAESAQDLLNIEELNLVQGPPLGM